jgi:hypothetical protein
VGTIIPPNWLERGAPNTEARLRYGICILRWLYESIARGEDCKRRRARDLLSPGVPGRPSEIAPSFPAKENDRPERIAGSTDR